MQPRIGTSVIDSTRRELGVGVLQKWVHCQQQGCYARVKFASGVKCVKAANVEYAVKRILANRVKLDMTTPSV